jgi:phage tail-like protein
VDPGALGDVEWSLDFALTDGHDGERPSVGEYTGEEDVSTGLKSGLVSLEDLEDISIVAAPGSTFGYQSGFRSEAAAITNLLVGHATRMRYRIAVLDCGDDQALRDVRAMRAAIDSKYAAFYYPWIRILDPVTQREITVPPSGFVAGIYARNDVERAVYKARRTRSCRGAIGLETILNKSQQDVLNPEGINCFRYFEGRGFGCGARGRPRRIPEWKYVNLRRYFIYLERSSTAARSGRCSSPTASACGRTSGARSRTSCQRVHERRAARDQAGDAYFVKCDRHDDAERPRQRAARLPGRRRRAAARRVRDLPDRPVDRRPALKRPRRRQPWPSSATARTSSFNFEVELGDLGVAGFQECSNIGMEVTVAEYRTGDMKENSVQKITGLNKSTDVTLKRGVIGKLDLYKWLDGIRRGDQKDALKTVVIHMKDETHSRAVLTWVLHRARIIKHVSGPLNAKGTDVAMEELTISYERLEMR